MARCFITQDQWRQAEIVLSAEESRHILNVLRLKPGSIVSVLDGRGKTGSAELMTIRSAAEAVIRILPGSRRSSPPPSPSLTLVQALPKHGAMDSIIKRSVEFGMSSIVPLLSKRVVARPSEGSVEHKRERWRKLAAEAAKQCGMEWLPDIATAISIDLIPTLLSKLGTNFVASLRQDARPLQTALTQLRGKPEQRISIIIGPEGDFTDEEYELIQSAGAVPVSFGHYVMRADTAALYAMSILFYEFRASSRTASQSVLQNNQGSENVPSLD